jgi:hypothetical protein
LRDLYETAGAHPVMAVLTDAAYSVTRPCTHKTWPDVRFSPKATELPRPQRNDAMGH